jgi:hypothetical protein
MDEWEIKKPLGQCSGTGKIISAGEEYFAALVETSEGLARQDFCEEYWQQNKPQVYCYWKSKLVPPEQKKKLFIDDDMLMVFFERLANETVQEKINFRFVLTLILMRKRRLKYDSSRNENEKEIWKLRITGSDTMVDVVNPHLSEDQIEQLSSQVGQILQVEL